MAVSAVVKDGQLVESASENSVKKNRVQKRYG